MNLVGLDRFNDMISISPFLNAESKWCMLAHPGRREDAISGRDTVRGRCQPVKSMHVLGGTWGFWHMVGYFAGGWSMS